MAGVHGDNDLGLATVHSHRRAAPWPLPACGLAALVLLTLCLAGSITMCAMLGYIRPLPH